LRKFRWERYSLLRSVPWQHSTMKIALGKFRSQRTLFLSILMITGTLLMASVAVHRSVAWDNGGGGLVQTPASFTNYELAGNEFIAGHSQGVSCPNMATVESQKCYSTQAEPAIRADPAGSFYGSSESVFCAASVEEHTHGYPSMTVHTLQPCPYRTR
jgi:hypothetical protein